MSANEDWAPFRELEHEGAVPPWAETESPLARPGLGRSAGAERSLPPCDEIWGQESNTQTGRKLGSPLETLRSWTGSSLKEAEARGSRGQSLPHKP